MFSRLIFMVKTYDIFFIFGLFRNLAYFIVQSNGSGPGIGYAIVILGLVMILYRLIL